MKRLCLAASVAASIVGLGCGGAPPQRPAPSPTTPARCIPAEGTGTMGACIPAPKVGATAPRALSGPVVPDVSYFQGNVNWAQAKSHISGAIIRVADGNFNDPAFARNWRELRRLHIWHAAYFFVRPGDCAAEARRAVALVNAQGGFDSGPLIADAEVPLNYGCAAAFVAQAKRSTGLPEVIYTAPGTWAGGPHGNAALWVASYGPSPGCVWTCAHVAWQYTDGLLGPSPHCVPGIGCDDISTDNGITKLGQPTPKPKPPTDRQRLYADYRTRQALDGQLRKLNCLHGYHHYTKRHRNTCTSLRHRHGINSRDILHLHAEGVF